MTGQGENESSRLPPVTCPGSPADDNEAVLAAVEDIPPECGVTYGISVSGLARWERYLYCSDGSVTSHHRATNLQPATAWSG